MRIFVTGGSGFIGSAIARHYINLGHDVLITGTRTENQVPGTKLLECSFTGLDWRALKNIDLVFHEAANNTTTCLDRDEMMKANYTAPIHLFNFLRHEAHCRRFVYASSTAVYGNGPVPYKEDQMTDTLTPYAESKWLFEGWVKAFAKKNSDIETCVGLRYCNVYGPGERHKGKRASMISQLIYQMIGGNGPVLFTDGEQRRDWIHVDDVVRMNVLAADYDGSDVFNCGTGRAVSFNSIVALINNALGTDQEIKFIDNPKPHMYQNFTECAMEKARRLLSYEPSITVESAIPGFVDYMKSHFYAGT